jgi:hypothetical protein
MDLGSLVNIRSVNKQAPTNRRAHVAESIGHPGFQLAEVVRDAATVEPRVGNLGGVKVTYQSRVSTSRVVVISSKLCLVSLAVCKVVLGPRPTFVELESRPVSEEQVELIAEQGRVRCMFLAKLFKVAKKTRIILGATHTLFR